MTEAMDKLGHKEDSGRIGYGPVAALFVTVGGYFLAQFFVSFLFFLTLLLTGLGREQALDWLDRSPPGLFLLSLVSSSILLGLIHVFIKSRGISWSRLGLVRPRFNDAVLALAGFGMYFVLSSIALSIIPILLTGIDADQQQELGFDRSTAGASLVWVFLALTIVPAFFEELVVRGFLYTGLRSKLPIVTSAVIASVIFGLGHLQLGMGAGPLWIAAIDTFVLSLILIYLREKSGSLWSPIAVHFMKNGLAFLLIFVFKLG